MEKLIPKREPLCALRLDVREKSILVVYYNTVEACPTF